MKPGITRRSCHRQYRGARRRVVRVDKRPRGGRDPMPERSSRDHDRDTAAPLGIFRVVVIDGDQEIAQCRP